MKSYLEYVTAYRTLAEQGKNLPAVQVRPVPTPAPDGPVVLVFSPHPDDECITGGLALRLQREAGARVINIPVTFGSREDRRAARREELKHACAHLGFELPTDVKLEGLQTPEEIARVLEKYRPQIIFFPHAGDWHGAHKRVHRLVMDALPLADINCLLAETEFWRPMKQPNLMVELPAEDLTALVEALSLHTGETARNPCHLSLPARMMDNVRRGGEVVGGAGGDVPDFTFATLYRLTRWADGVQREVFEGGRNLPSGENTGELLNLQETVK